MYASVEAGRGGEGGTAAERALCRDESPPGCLSRMTMPTMWDRKLRLARRSVPAAGLGAGTGPPSTGAMDARPSSDGRIKAASPAPAAVAGWPGMPPLATPGDIRLPTSDSSARVQALNLHAPVAPLNGHKFPGMLSAAHVRCNRWAGQG